MLNDVFSLHKFSKTVFEKPDSEFWLEIGFGGGEHLINQALNNQTIHLIGAEPFNEGIVKALTAIKANEINNISLIHGDIRPDLEEFPNEILSKVFILFPDPWPKKRHHKRRLINQDFLKILATKMKKAALLRFATDIADYAEQVLMLMSQNSNFEWQATNCLDWQNPPQDHFTTRYETKALGDCKPMFFDFKKI